MNQKIKPSEYENVQKKYLKYRSSEKVAREYSVEGSTIVKILKKLNIKMFDEAGRKYYFKQDIFNKGITSSDLSYILGILYADGCNTKGNIILGLQYKDSQILNKIKKVFDKKGKLLFVKRRKPHHQDKLRLELNSVKLSNDLKKLGMVEKKSLILKFPSESIVPIEFMPDFIRGFFDGDGSVYFGEDNKIRVCLTSSLDFCNGMHNFLNSIGIKTSFRHYKNPLSKSIRIESNSGSIKFYQYIYNKDTNLFMKRKRDKFNKYLSEPRNAALLSL